MYEVTELVARRGVEMGYFRDSLLSPDILEDSAQPGHFKAMMALATSDYQVSTSELANALQMSEEEVQRWGDNSRNDLEVPPQDIREKVFAFIATDMEKKLTSVN